MAQYYFSAKAGEDATLCIAPLTDRRIELSAEPIDDPSGYFLYRTRGGSEPSEVEIIAKLASREAALKLREMLGME